MQLVEVINEDYNDFISLSSKLMNVDGAVLRMRTSLLSVKVQPPSLSQLSHGCCNPALLVTYSTEGTGLKQSAACTTLTADALL